MKRIRLTQGQCAFVDNSDFDYLSQWTWHCKRTRKKSGGWKQYAARNETVNGRQITIRMHVAIAERAGFHISRLIDHWDGDGLNNRRANLRPANHQQNGRNRHATLAASGVRGVYRRQNGKWRAMIGVNKRLIDCGTYDTILEAAAARRNAEREHFGEFAV